MSTPVSLRQIEIARQKAVRRNRQSESMLYPLSLSYPLGDTRSHSHKPIDFTIDKAGGYQYTSFEVSRKNHDNRTVIKPLSPPPIEDVPIDVDTDDYKVDPNNIVSFAGRQHFLSNLYSIVITVEGHEYPSIEHYYQACKLYTLGGARTAAEIRHIIDPGQVKSIAKRLLRAMNVPPEKISEWKRTQGPVLLHHAISYKFLQNSDLRVKLLETKEAILAHAYERDNLYATGCSRDVVSEWADNNSGQIIKTRLKQIGSDVSQNQVVCLSFSPGASPMPRYAPPIAENSSIPSRLDHSTVVYVPLVGRGKNLLGFINMKVREQLRNFQRKHSVGLDPMMNIDMRTLSLESQSAENK